MKELILQRKLFGAVNTQGVLTLYENSLPIFSCDTLELAWHDNQSNISCVPEGAYLITHQASPTLGECFLLHDTVPRENILIHSGNLANSDDLARSDTKGCILVGRDYKDFQGDGVPSILNSRITLKELLKIIPDSMVLQIKNA